MNMPDWLDDWRKILLYALFTALILFALSLLFVPQKGRYVMIDVPSRDNQMLYMDTATGKIYRIRSGSLLSSPHDN